MIQSSHPSSLKLTCSAFLLHLDLDFLPCRFPWRLLSAVLRLRRALNCSALSSSSSSSPRDLIFSFISLNKFSLFLDRVTSHSTPEGDGWPSPGGFRNILNSAPTSSSLSERVETSNRYACLRKGESVRSNSVSFVLINILPFFFF
uniref:Uncharacterized protein n=1 Tax=Sinocyclocheilus anshuiensis TaxID=1608454 RepID=A0A671L913_9TELE